MIFTDYDGDRLGDSENQPDWSIWIAESSYELDGEQATYCRDGRVPLPAPEEPSIDPESITTIADITDALADASDAVSSNAEDVATLSDAIAELSEIVAALVPTETESEE